ncbi:ATP-binding protein [Sulfitobacter alexandrii]|nr:ATP-binding protein [Sulfitobacter alexandrii]
MASQPAPVSDIPSFRFTFDVDSSQMAVRGALLRLRGALSPLSLEPEELETLELVLAEILNNIVEHAYADHRPGDTITVSGEHRTDGLHLRIRDRGKAMPNGQPPLGRPAFGIPRCGAERLPEGGFGWPLIRDLARDLCYRRLDGENTLDLRVAIARQSRADGSPPRC